MFQSFEDTTTPEHGPERLSALRAAMAQQGLAGFIVPRADVYQGEYVAPHDDRLAWLTGFTGSAGWCVALANEAGVFIDGRYRVQVRSQVDPVFAPVDWPETSLGTWIRERLEIGDKIGFDPWLLTLGQHADIAAKLPEGTLVPCDNLIDRIWSDQPPPPQNPVFDHPVPLAGESRDEKITRLANALPPAAHAVLTLPDSIAWLLNIRGSDIPRNPVPHAFAILHQTGQVSLFIAPAKLRDIDLGPQVTLHSPEAVTPTLQSLQGAVLVDKASVPLAVVHLLEASGIEVIAGQDPCILPKACKNPTELEGSRQAHLRDAAAMVRFLAWLDRTSSDSLTEIDVVQRLEAERRATNALRDISFETISGAGPNGAIVHYRVSDSTNRPLGTDTLLLVDSGGQYVDGTTDITRTIAIGSPPDGAAEAFTRVLKGMINLSKLRFPTGLAGRDIDALARAALWEVGMDYGHGTGHGVGSYLCVHEGPARIARTGTVPFQPGMILSNEPGFYLEGAYGIRIENLIAVEEAKSLPHQTAGPMLQFETLTWVPIDTRLVVTDLLTQPERDWLNSYHTEVLHRIGPLVQGADHDWLEQACRLV